MTLDPNSSASSTDDSTLHVSQEFLGRWQHLVSTTNWEKGRIITAWREQMRSAGEPLERSSDETWSQLVGNVTSQHVGRLRRVYERFGEVFEQYAGLYWSHFLAALDWDDAEMWLEGAVQSGWSVSQLKRQRLETLGEVAADEARDAVSGEVDEDFDPRDDASQSTTETLSDYREIDEFSPPDDEEASAYDDEETDEELSATSIPFDAEQSSPSAEQAATVRPFADLPDLPDDFGEAFERFKMAILRQRMTGWADLAAEDALAVLAALRELVLAPEDAS